jgi:hypothetical protein
MQAQGRNEQAAQAARSEAIERPLAKACALGCISSSYNTDTADHRVRCIARTGVATLLQCTPTAIYRSTLHDDTACSSFGVFDHPSSSSDCTLLYHASNQFSLHHSTRCSVVCNKVTSKLCPTA